MKILHVNKFFDLRGGADIYLQDLMRHQSEFGFEVHALSTRSPGNLPSRDASRFVTRYDLSKSDGAITDVKKAMNYLWNFEAKRAMEQSIREIKPDVIHLHNIYHHLSTSILSPIRRARIPCVQTLHDLKLACPNYRMYTEGALCERCKGGRYFEAVKHRCVSNSFLPNMLAALEMGMAKARQSYERTVHTFICPSQFMADKMIEWGEPASKFETILMPVTVPVAEATRGGGYLLAVGRLSPEKGYDQLVRAVSKVPNVKIKIAGIGPEEDRLKSVMRSLGVTNVELVGFKRGADLEKLYREAEGFIACPIGYENSPLSVLDALAYGLPILATRIGGLPEMVKDFHNGFLVEIGNTDAWTATLKRFVALTPEARSQMALASRERALNMYPDWKKHTGMVGHAYERALG